MELLESIGVRPRQARYQAALRPDYYNSNSTGTCRILSIFDFVKPAQRPFAFHEPVRYHHK
jgi:hypothetical protein